MCVSSHARLLTTRISPAHTPCPHAPPLPPPPTPPPQAHKSHTIVLALTAVDVGFDNPVFAALELDYGDVDTDASGEAAAEAQKHLTLYELDLGLNHVVRKWSEPVDHGANLLIPVPGGGDGPGGVLVCAENFIIFKNQEHADVRALIPRHPDLPGDRSVLIVSWAMHRQKSFFFFLVQSEYGDLYKVTLTYEEEVVSDLTIKYFDTIPVATALCVLRMGFLFAASEFGNHALYQFEGIGEADDDVACSALSLVATEDEGYAASFFAPRPLRNLAVIDEVESLAPLIDMKVANLLGEETPQIFALCGQGPRSTLRMLRPGLGVTEMAVSELPGHPSAVWTVKKAATDEFDAYIVVSFVNATLVLSIGETVDEVSDSGFLGTMPSLHVCLMGDDSLLQVHPSGIRHIHPEGRVIEWKAPGRKSIMRVAANGQQVAAAMSGGDLFVFEMDAQGALAEAGTRELSEEVACLALAPIPEGRKRARFLAVGFFDGTIRILSAEDEDLKGLALQQVPSPPESLLILMTPVGGGDVRGSGALYLNAGLQNGVLWRTEIDQVTGALSDTRTRFVGAKAPKLFPLQVQGQRSMLCLSSRAWLGYSSQGRFTVSPLSYESLEFASSFSSDQCPEGIVGVSGDSLRILSVDRLGEQFDTAKLPLRYTPRRFVINEEARSLVVVETDHQAMSADERAAAIQSAVEARKQAVAEAKKASGDGKSGGGGDGAVKMETDGEGGGDGAPADEPVEDGDGGAKEGEGEEMVLPDEQFGVPRTVAGKWCSCIRVVSLVDNTLETSGLLELEGNEAALCACLVTFTDGSNKQPTSDGAQKSGVPHGQLLLAVGTAKDLVLMPRSCAGGYIHLYEFVDEGKGLSLLHKTPVDDAPLALCAFQGKLLAGVGKVLRVYDLGKRKLLRKCEHRGFPNLIVSITSHGDRIYVGDVQESFFFVKYKRGENALYIFADDTVPRWVTSSLRLDFDTVMGGDKFGNVFVARLPAQLSEEIENDPTGGRLKWDQGKLNGAPSKLNEITQYHVGEIVTAMQKVTMLPGGVEVVLFSTIMGGVGALFPFSSREDVDFFSHLEMHLRQEYPPLCGRDHMAYRSAYFPVKDTVDGDLCEQYALLPPELQARIAEELDRTPGEVLKKLEDIRNRMM
eukprot:jgi/Mesvir1/26639/Mv20046-RA.2